MAETRLQEYSAKIKDLIRQDRYDEAIAHCQHILRHYPRHLETYSLLGEACLEKEMVREAIEFFQRTLSADPENLIARVGLGIVYDQQGALLEAIWQMERAFELSPGNTEVRRELQRLYVQRDGVEKPRLKLTPGALGRLYSRNGLYEQAIGEFYAILRQDPDLPDIQIALIEALWREGRRLDAVEICLDLLQSLPNCLKANLILGEIWFRGGHEDAGAEKLEVARALDPENRMAKELFGKDSPLPPEEVWLEELEPTAAELDMLRLSVERDQEAVQEAEFADVSLEAEEGLEPEAGWEPGGEVPDWLRDMGLVVLEEEGEALLASEQDQEELVEPVPGEATPAWLQELVGEEEGAGPLLETAPTEEDRAELIGVEADSTVAPEKEGEVLPQWLQELGAPRRDAPLAGEELPGEGELEDLPDWLRDLRPGQEEPVPPLVALDEQEVTADLEQEVEVRAAEVEDLAAPVEVELPVVEVVPAAEEETADHVPESLRALVAAGLLAEEDLAEAIAAMSPEDLEAQRAESVPDWLQDLLGDGEPRLPTPPPAEAVEMPAEIEELGAPEVEVPAPEAVVEEEVEGPATEELPEWLAALVLPEAEVQAPAEMIEEVAEMPAAEEAPKWQEMPGVPEAEVPAPAEEVEAEAEAPAAEEVPEWQEMPGVPEAEVPAPAEAVEKEAEIPAAEEIVPPAVPVPAAEVVLPAPAAAAVEATETEAAGRRLRDLRDQLRSSPRNHALRLEVARLSAGQKEWSSTLDHYEKLIATRKFLPEVLEDLLHLVDEDVDRARAYQLLGDAYVQDDKLEQALEMYRHSRQALLKH